MAPIEIPAPSYIESFDGTKLAVFETGNPDGPVLFLVNGLGGNLTAWKFVIDYYRDTLRIISFDYRGMYKSGTPPTRDFSMEAHVRDAVTVMDHFAVDQAILMGWSMGVQVVLELVARLPERTRALILANGAYGRPLDVAMPRLKPLAKLSMDLLATCAPHLRPALRPVLSTTAPLKLAKVARLVSRHLDEEVFLQLAQEFAELDFENYRDCVEALLDHDAEAVLDHIKVPTLIIGGGRDFFTPAVFAETMANRIADAELHMIKDASHYCAVEYPGIIISHMERFFLDKLGMQ